MAETKKKTTKKTGAKSSKSTPAKASTKNSTAKKAPASKAKKAPASKAKKAPASKAKKAPASKAKKSTTKKSSKSTKPVIDDNKFAVIVVNSHQLLVHEGLKYEIDRIDGEKGDKLDIKDVLLVVDGKKVSVGKPLVKGAVVNCTIDSQKKGKKRKTFKYKAKSRYRKTYGHRDHITRLLINTIKA